MLGRLAPGSEVTTGGVVAVDPPDMNEMLKQRCVLIQCVISHYITVLPSGAWDGAWDPVNLGDAMNGELVLEAGNI